MLLGCFLFILAFVKHRQENSSIFAVFRFEYMNMLNTAISVTTLWRQVLLGFSILCICMPPIDAACRRITYTAKPPCEEALGDDIVNRPACSTVDFNVKVIPCELRQSADLVALRAANYRALPNIPVSITIKLSVLIKEKEKKKIKSIHCKHWYEIIKCLSQLHSDVFFTVLPREDYSALARVLT